MKTPAGETAVPQARSFALSDQNNVRPDTSQLRLRVESAIGASTLHRYQWEGITFLYRSRSALLADEMGLGKTVQAAVALSLLLDDSEVNRVLVVAPASLTSNWLSELRRWVPTVTAWRIQGSASDREAFYLLPVPVLVGSYEQIRQDGLDRIPAETFDLVVLDEAQRIKNRDSATALACRLLPRTRAWALSATPLENHRSDVVSILSFLDRTVDIHISATRLRTYLRSMMLRRTKSEVRADLPPVIVQDLKLELGVEQRRRYDDLWTRRADVFGTQPNADPSVSLLGLLTRLKLACNAVGTASSKFDALTTICEGLADSARVLVFSQFVSTLRWVSSRLSLPHSFLVGSMPLDARYAAIKRFQKGSTPRLLLVSLRAGGVGLNLGCATHVVLFDRWWNPAAEIQAVYRAHRFERQDPLHVIRFLVADSIEERIANVLERKERLFDRTIDGLGQDATRLTRRDLMDILQMGTASFSRDTN